MKAKFANKKIWWKSGKHVNKKSKHWKNEKEDKMMQIGDISNVESDGLEEISDTNRHQFETRLE